MHPKKKKIAIGILLLGICVLVWLDIRAHVKKNRLLEVLSQKGTVVLLPSVTQALLSDLESADKDRMKQWRSYFQMCAASHSNLVTRATAVQDAFGLYISKERPGRSNYFNRLVFALKDQSTLLSRDGLFGYLGNPDFTSAGPDGETVQYAYESYGKDYLASAVVSNDVVVRIDIYVK
ncbi:MAG TPA: hypothetical protein VN673_06805 [Clostridia bacterium]|nr:hypothetical protein [Clostridia bacterium]